MVSSLVFGLLIGATVLGQIAAQQCKISTNTIIGENSISTHSKSTVQACCNLCDANPRCIAFTLNTATGDCFLKDNTNGKAPEADRTSGTNGRPPPPPPGWNDACTQPELSNFPFCDKSLTIDARVADLVARIQLNETGPLLTARQSIAIPR